MDDATVLRLMLTAGLSVAGGGGVVALALYALAGRDRRPLFPPVGPIDPTLNGLALFAAFATFMFPPYLVHPVLNGVGFFHWLYGAEFPNGWPEAAANTVRSLWAAALAFPFQVALLVALVRAVGARSPLDVRGLGRNVMAGYLTWLMVTPVAFLVFFLANLVHHDLTGRPPDKHPLTALGDAAGTREWTLFVLQTVVLAPFLEEFVFRGLLLPWLARRRHPAAGVPVALPPSERPLIIQMLAVGVAVVLQVEDVHKAWAAGDHYAAAAHLVPGLFFAALVPLQVVPFRRLRRHLRVRSGQHVRAILASSALFAAFHTLVWPSPVPLMVLAVGLGYLYLRTRSLVGPVVVHGLFNAVSAVYLLLGGPA